MSVDHHEGEIPKSGMIARSRPPNRKSSLRRIILAIRSIIVDLHLNYLRWLGMDLQPGCRISLRAKLDFTNPRGVHIGEGSYVTFGAVILAHDMSRVMETDTFIGRNCFIGANAIVMPGIRIGDQCIVGSGAVVTRDVPPNSIVAGNPAVVMRTAIQTTKWGILADRLEDARRTAQANAPN